MAWYICPMVADRQTLEGPDCPDRGDAGQGRPFTPSDLPDVPPQPRERREAPSPGVPVTDDTYERLKEDATRRAPSNAPAHEDPQDG
jgi:hypothetical protein